MVDRARKISELTATTSVAGNGVLVVVDNSGDTPITKKITVSNLLSNSANVKATAITTTTAPSTATSNGTVGEVRYSSEHVYVCVATNTWKRSPLETW
jgi:ApbE superfamily uncharacterized protein (UPF0280 family)